MSEQAKEAFRKSLERKRGESEIEHEKRINELTKQLLSDEMYEEMFDSYDDDGYF